MAKDYPSSEDFKNGPFSVLVSPWTASVAATIAARDAEQRRITDLTIAKGPGYLREGCRCYVTWEDVSMTRPPDLHLNGCPAHS